MDLVRLDFTVSMEVLSGDEERMLMAFFHCLLGD